MTGPFLILFFSSLHMSGISYRGWSQENPTHQRHIKAYNLSSGAPLNEAPSLPYTVFVKADCEPCLEMLEDLRHCEKEVLENVHFIGSGSRPYFQKHYKKFVTNFYLMTAEVKLSNYKINKTPTAFRNMQPLEKRLNCRNLKTEVAR